MCSLQLLHHSDVQRLVWGIFSLWEAAGGREREAPDVWTSQSHASAVVPDSVTYPWGRALVWHHALVSVECSARFVCVCKGAVVREKSQTVLFPCLARSDPSGCCRRAHRSAKINPWRGLILSVAEANGRLWELLVSESQRWSEPGEREDLNPTGRFPSFPHFPSSPQHIDVMFNITAISLTNEEHIKCGPFPLEAPGSDRNSFPCWSGFQDLLVEYRSPSRSEHYSECVCQSRHFPFMCHRQG